MTRAGRRCRVPTYLIVVPSCSVLKLLAPLPEVQWGGVAMQPNALARTAPEAPKEQGGGGDPCSWS